MTDDEMTALGTQGWFSRESVAGTAQAAAAAQRRVGTAQFSVAKISRRHQADSAVRDDASLWLSPADDDFSELTAMFEALRFEVNQEAWLALSRFEVQLGYYAGGGARYVRHRDAFAGAASRRLTAIAYLNPAWTKAHGGELRLYGKPVVDVAPELGRLVVVLSAEMEHEVLPSWAPRLAATAWYYA